MSSTKEKIVSALGCALEDLGESRLIDILLDAFEAKKQEIRRLEAANVAEYERLHGEREVIRQDMQRMRSDPLFAASGEYYFELDARQFQVTVTSGSRISLIERKGLHSVMAQQLSREEWFK